MYVLDHIDTDWQNNRPDTLNGAMKAHRKAIGPPLMLPKIISMTNAG